MRTWCPSGHVLTGLTRSAGPPLLRCSRLLPPWLVRWLCHVQPVDPRPLGEQERIDPGLTWPTQCSQHHQYAITGAGVHNGTLAEIQCCRVMQECGLPH